FPEGSSSHQRASCNCSVFWRIFSSSTDPPPKQHYTSGRTTQRESFRLVEEDTWPSGVAPPLEAISFSGPIHEPFHVFAVLPGKMKELARCQIGGFFST